MKRNGFTLVEMMAVIVLIALLSVVGISTYRNVNESAKKKTLNAKIEEIKTAAVKWAKENNITSKTMISVNALVVEGYITADENEIDELPVIENPVTGENMICNTVDISFDQGEAKTIYNENVQNCDLATQSLIDTNISIKVVDENNIDKTGSGTIANWTNKNVMIIVTSTQYDSKAVSISYDFEGNTTTKNKSGLQQYTGDTYLKEQIEYDKYYNVFKIDANLLLDSKVIVTYNIAGELSKSRAYTIRIDKEEATATIESNSEWLAEDKPITVKVDDGKGSGPRYFYVTKTANFENPVKEEADYKGTATELTVGKYYIWTEDKAGNRSQKYKMVFEVNNVDAVEPECKVVFKGTEGDHGWFMKDEVAPFGENTVKAGISGVNIGVNMNENSPEYSGFAMYDTIAQGPGTVRTTNTLKAGEMYYCHVKSMAGKYANNSMRLYLDRTPPIINISVTDPNKHTQTKTATVTIQDLLSGLNTTTTFKYGFSMSNTVPPTNWTDFTITAPKQSNAAATGGFTTSEKLTGTYYLWIDTSGFKDYAGNYANNAATSPMEHSSIFGPYKFDNTPPVCNGNNGKTTWTKGTYTINQLCIDNNGTTDQSLCAKDVYTIDYGTDKTVKDDSVTIADKAGNTTVCDYHVYLDNTQPICNVRGGKTNWTKGTYTVSQPCVEDAVNQSGCLQPTFTKDYGNTDTVKTDTITISDNVGNTRICPVDIYLDNTPPECSTVTGQNTEWKNTPNTVTVNCRESAVSQSGCSSRNSSLTISSTQRTASIDISDAVGNVTTCGPYNFYVDTTPPTCGFNNGKTNWTNLDYTIIQYCEDAVGTTDQSNCVKQIYTAMYFRWDNFRRDSLIISDNAGNSTTCSFDLYLDNTKPSCNLTEPGPDGENGWYKSSSVTITSEFQDNGNPDIQSGVNRKGTSETPGSTNNRTSVTITRNGTGIQAYCFVEDLAGNQGSNSITINKDDGSEARNGGCSAFGGKTNWTNTGNVPLGLRLNRSPISGCKASHYVESTWGSDCSYTFNYDILPGQSESVFSAGIDIPFYANSGAVITCPQPSYNVYVDKIPPTCDTTKTLTGSTSGVTVNVICSDDGDQSGCVSSGDGQGTYSSLKATSCYTVLDNAGNSCQTCANITSGDCNCSYCHHYTNTCEAGNIYKQGTISQTGCYCSGNGWYSMGIDSGCTCYKWYYCAKGSEYTCTYGCDLCYY